MFHRNFDLALVDGADNSVVVDWSPLILSMRLINENVVAVWGTLQ